ncbi:DUF6542 domain-containing protein [Streptomyces galilaeus]|uniref:DUF6542 domain-containing protein n=2 Tax=Streptomyces TaxID=1883 RepID=A0ABW9I985_STRGJ
MEQHRTRRGTVPLPPQTGRGGAGDARRGNGSVRAGRADPPRRPAPRLPKPARSPVSAPPPAVGRRMPNPRLTGLGTGLFAVLVMVTLGWLERLLLGASPTAQTAYGVLFLPVCVLCGLWVRRADLVAAPVVVPIAFAVGVLPLAKDGEGPGARLMALATALATQVGWLYGGTLLAALIVLVRRVVLVARRRRATARR